MAIKVTLKHKDFGEVVIENVTEIHYCYPSPMGKRIAFESDIDGTGCTYPVEDVIEFEAAEQSVHPTGGNCAECSEIQVVFDGCCINCGTPATSG